MPRQPLRRRLSFGLFAAAVSSFAPPAAGQAAGYPVRTVTLVVPYAPGGGTDTFARALASHLTRLLGQPVVVENRSGASGNIGADAVARSAADGHTLLYAASTLALSRLVPNKLAFDPQRDLTPVARTISIPQVLVAHPSLGAAGAADLVALSRRDPHALSYGSGGPGSANHLAMELFKARSGLVAQHIPYRGTAPAMNAVLSGEVQLAFSVPPVAQGHIRAGKLRALAVSSPVRSSALPEVPSLRELGFADFEAMQWHGLFAPARTPAPVVERLHAALRAALAQPDFKALLAQEGAEAASGSPADFAREFGAEIAKWQELVRAHRVALE